MDLQTTQACNADKADGQQFDFDADVAEAAAPCLSSEEQEKLQELRKKRIYSLSTVTKKKNQLKQLMTTEKNLQLVKSEFETFKDLLRRYEESYMLYYSALPRLQGDKEAVEFAEKNEAFSDFKSSVMKWVYIMEQRLQNDKSCASETCSKLSEKSRTSSHASSKASSVSARMKEKARLAGLLVEKSMMKEKQALQAKEQELLLDIEIAKSKAREKAYASELDSNISVSHSDHAAMGDPTSLQPEEEPINSKKPALDPNVTNLQSLSQPVTEEPVGASRVHRTVKPMGKKIHLNPNAPVFHSQAPMFQGMQQDFVEMQKRQNEQILAAHQTLASAVSLPQPEVPKFKGDPIQFHTFIRSFDARIAPLTSKAEDLIFYLEQHLEGEARDLISGCLYMDPSNGYTAARSLLEKEYGDPYKISMGYISKVLEWPTIKHDDTQGLKKLSIFLTQCKQAMKSIAHMQVLDHAPNMQLIVQKLPNYLQNKWRDFACKLRTQQETPFITRFEDLVSFIKQAAEAANDPVFGRDAMQISGMPPKSKTPKDKRAPLKPAISSFATKPDKASVSSHHQHYTNASNKKTCLFCKGSHDIDACQAFNKKTVDEKRSYMKENKMCFGCYGSGHTSKGYLKKRTCSKCGKFHPTSLHIDGFKFSKAKEVDDAKNMSSSVESSTGDTEVTSAACNAESYKTIFHAILPVKVHQEGSDATVCTYAFYDNGSTGCFITEELSQDLKITGTETTLQLKTMHGTDYVKSQSVNKLVVADMMGQNVVHLPKAFTREAIPVSHQQIPKRQMIKNWAYLEKAAQDMPENLPDIGIGLLVGSNCPLALEPLEVIPSQDGGPFAVKLRHGWTINGPLEVEVNQDTVTCNRIIMQEMEQVKEVPQPSAVMMRLEQDFSEHDHGSVPGELGYSKEDIKFLSIAKMCKKDETGHFEIPLPFRKEDIMMPNNRDNAVSRTKWQRRKMLQNETYRHDYCLFMDTIFKRGYAIKAEVESSSLPLGKFWFLPHHGIYHPRKPKKIRVVFDCSSRCQGISLNDVLLQGPDLTNSLVGVLTRFRENPVAFMADVEAMFFQVKVPAEQQDFLRFLWWPGGNLDLELQEFKMTVHLFGAISSPSVSNFALRKCADEAEEIHGVKTSDTIRRNFYVDDCLKSVPDDTTAQELVNAVREACMDSGFRLTKFTSNSIAVLKSLPQDELSKELQARDLDYSSLPIERVLGIQWSVEQDLFKFAVFIPAKPITRRGILSMVSSVYDPLGFIAPYILSAKLILQDLCKESHISWDDEVPSDYKSRWEKWITELPHLEKIHVDRCIRSSSTQQETSKELHVFSDASSVGYGCAGYLRVSDQAGNIQVSFLMGKARLAPLKMITIPKLELTAATVAVKIGRMLDQELEEKPDKIIYHTDSTTVLHYLHSERKRFPVFVANRTQLINNFSNLDQWRYVNSRQNPADVASRGLGSPEQFQDSMWLDGPTFLRMPETDWPQQPVSFHAQAEETSNVVSTTDPTDTLDAFITHYSDWHRLKRATAFILRLRKILLAKARKQTEESSRDGLSIEELDDAESCIIKWVQRQCFGPEIQLLTQSESYNPSRGREKKRNGKMPRWLHRLDPFLDCNGFMRVGGRLSKASFPMEMMHPLMLPKKHHVSLLIIRAKHCSLGHAGRNHVLASVREKYWILAANSLVRHVISKCVSCRRYRKPVCLQKMSDLPQDRLEQAAPFTYTGVDLFGPFLVKEGRKEVKRYGVLFTCLVSRAIHVETANSLSTDSFIHALRRFAARRGNVKLMRSDNGTNFVGARKELWKSFQEMDHENIHNQLLKCSMEWKFNPPGASHMGGAWERLIRSVRDVLTHLLHEFGSRLNDETLRTLLCEAEATVNSRPMTTLSDDPDDLHPLSPCQLLTMKTNMLFPLPGRFNKCDIYSRKKWRQVQYLANLFWSRWRREYLSQLQSRQKWTQPQRNLRNGDLVLIKEDDIPRNKWMLGRVIEVNPDSHGHVRSVVVHTQHSDYKRPISKLVLLLPVEEQ